nr:hypothetical protein Itr_chr03CG25910 [Ipomoea trifida]GMC70932.1 hypothetical protein Iba_chr03aCG20420 [Ipomoea batatas]GMC74859.1 hypothetical protein Iba_chr03cCG14070 [Ipomoea batatas]GMC77501.1 hypothetical protein Iba_chr03eCG11320 [Ipomoea batatas]
MDRSDVVFLGVGRASTEAHVSVPIVIRCALKVKGSQQTMSKFPASLTSKIVATVD